MANFCSDSSLPSQVTHQPWVYAEALNDNAFDFKDDGNEERGIPSKTSFSPGKWMIFNDCVRVMPKSGMTNHDFAWRCIKTLVESNQSSVIGIHSAKASTAWSNAYETKPGSTNGVICCYTRDYSDKLLAKQAADAIRKAYTYPRDILYKCDEDTYAGKYRHLGSKCVSLYKHTMKNEMYERCPENPSAWKIVQVQNS